VPVVWHLGESRPVTLGPCGKRGNGSDLHFEFFSSVRLVSMFVEDERGKIMSVVGETCPA
jgi:hypothetical protein